MNPDLSQSPGLRTAELIQRDSEPAPMSPLAKREELMFTL